MAEANYANRVRCRACEVDGDRGALVATNLRTGDSIEGRGFHSAVQFIGFLHYMHDGNFPTGQRWCSAEAQADRTKGERASWEDWEEPVRKTARGLTLGNWTLRTDGKPPRLGALPTFTVEFGGGNGG